MIPIDKGNILIRPMQVKDIPQVQEIDEASFPTPWPKNSFLFELMDNQASLSWVAEIEEGENQKTICGMLVLWLILDEAHIGTIATHPQYRRKGIGMQLLMKALKECKGKGANVVFLEVREFNYAAQNLYKQLGFEQTGLRKKYYADTGEDAFLMTLENLQEKFI